MSFHRVFIEWSWMGIRTPASTLPSWDNDYWQDFSTLACTQSCLHTACMHYSWVSFLHSCPRSSHTTPQAENKLSPEGKKIPTRGRGASRRKQEEADDACGQSYSKNTYLIIGVYCFQKSGRTCLSWLRIIDKNYLSRIMDHGWGWCALGLHLQQLLLQGVYYLYS